MAMNQPTQPEDEQLVLVRDSEEHKDYLKHQFGTIKSMVNAFETRIAISGRALLLIYVVYITVKAGVGSALPTDVPWLNVSLLVLDILMLALQVMGLEGSIPGLTHLADDLESQGKTEEAKKVHKSADIAQFLMAATAIDVVLQYAPHTFTVPGMGLVDIAWLSFSYDKLLFIVRVVVISRYLKAMARLEKKEPKVISQAEHKKQQHQAEQEQIRMDNTAIQGMVDQSLDRWTKAQDAQLNQWYGQLAGNLQQRFEESLLDFQQSRPEPTIDYEAIAKAMMPILKATVQSQVRATFAEIQSQFSRPPARPEPPNQGHHPESGPSARANHQGQSQGHPGQPTFTVIPGAKSVTETAARPNGSQEERLQAAYDELSKDGAHVSGRALAGLAHVNRDTTNAWLARVKGQSSDPDEANTGEMPSVAQGQ